VKKPPQIDTDPGVHAVARGLGIKQDRDLGTAINDVAVGRVEAMLLELQYEPNTLDELRELVHHHTGLHVVRISSDEDLRAAQEEYAEDLRGLPKQLSFEFATNTEALVVRRRTKDERSNRRFLALVDARGERENRAWFGDWHETTHTMVPEPGNSVAFRRTSRERPEPVEQVIDKVAASLGFWAPLVKPALLANVASGVDLLKAFDVTRLELAPAASREASFRAFANLLPRPILVLWVDYDCRAADRRPGGNPSRSLALRAKTVIRNGAADAIGMNIPNNYRIPADSVITQASRGSWATVRAEADDLGRWRDSTGRALARCPVKITARGQWAAIVVA
jgi:hypothetical protein